MVEHRTNVTLGAAATIVVALASGAQPGFAADALPKLGAELAYHDPHVPEVPELSLSACELDDQLPAADLACIVTAHPEVDYERLVREGKLVLDLRGVTRGIEAANLVRL